MNNELWEKIAAVDFDSPPSEYGFSTRLAKENYWTKDFTEKAIEEYKKFMYLAATSEMMVSPSETVDAVWHQHLIFTQSYQDFCQILGKQVQHVPSTHNREEFEKFRQAKERTNKLYSKDFGVQPAGIWEWNTMYDSLGLDKAKFKIRTIIIVGILLFLACIFPFYYFLRPFYVQIGNPDFILGFIGLAVASFAGLNIYNRYQLKKMVHAFHNDSFIYHLQPMEMVYLKTQKLSQVINGTVNQLVVQGTVQVNADNTIELVNRGATNSIEQLQCINSLNTLGRTYYPTLLKVLTIKPVFTNTANCMDAFKKYFNKSKKFGYLFYFNFGVLAIVLLAGLVRLITGILRDKPVVEIAVALSVMVIFIILFLHQLTVMTSTVILPNLYRNHVLPEKYTDENWQWTYFLSGTAVLTPSFVPLANYVDTNSGSGGTSCGTSCGSSCGSSCSSCGGCGGD
jgi:hypothetical protein